MRNQNALFYQPQIKFGVLALSPEESGHAIKVLRMRAGDVIEITDGAGAFYQATITNPDTRGCEFTITTSETQAVKDYRIHVAVALTKNMDRMEWFVEKAVEIGVDEITFMVCKTSERTTMNMDRIEKLAISAMKQSRRATLPALHDVASFASVVLRQASQKFIGYVDLQNPLHLKSAAVAGSDYLILIGPEGDFSPAELQAAIDAGFQKVSLGPARLRTETAALTAVLTLNLLNH